jgi:hypothetical protein
LALLTGINLERNLSAPQTRRAWLLILACLSLSLLLASVLIASAELHFFPLRERFAFAGLSPLLRAIVLLISIGAAGLAVFTWIRRWKSQTWLFAGLSIVLILYMDMLGAVLVRASVGRSTRDLAAKAARYIQQDTQVVIYDTTLESLPFYLKIRQPIWSIWSGEKASVFGSFYLAEMGALSAPGFGRALLTFEEFNQQWAKAPKDHFAVFIKRKNLAHLERETGHAATIRIEDGDMLLVSN